MRKGNCHCLSWRSCLNELAQSHCEDKVVWPDIISTNKNEDVVNIQLKIPKNLDYFKGHFPNAPILAGVVQLHWAVEYAKEAFLSEDVEVANIEVLKFQVVIAPGQDMFLTLTKKSPDKILFSYESNRGKHSSGRLVFVGDS